MDEFELINTYFVPLSSSESQFLKNDGGVFKPKSNLEYVVSTDTIIESIHFKGDESPDMIAKKALRTNLSDLAAMGAVPEFYSLALSLPKSKANDFIQYFVKGLSEDQNEFNIKLLGGDLTASPDFISITISIIGSVPTGEALSRSGSKVNDLLYVTGTLGLSNIGLLNLYSKDTQFSEAKSRYFLPQPRIKFSTSIRKYVSSMIDISDGFIQDCGHLAKSSNLEFVINLKDFPICNIEILSYEERIKSALIGGDDYELLFTTPPTYKKEIEDAANFCGLKLTNVGFVRSGKNGKVTSNNSTINIDAYKHF